MGFMSYKKRTIEETESILRDFAGGLSILEICTKHSLSESGFYRILGAARGTDLKGKSKSETKIKRLEKVVQERNREIQLLKNILKKS